MTAPTSTELLNALAYAVVRSGSSEAVIRNLRFMGGGAEYEGAIAKLEQCAGPAPTLCELMGEHQGPFNRQEVYNRAGGQWVGPGDCKAPGCDSTVLVPEHMREREAA